MFKTLFATSLLLFSCSTGSLKSTSEEFKITQPKMAYNSNRVYGYYNFVDSFNFRNVLDDSLSFTIDIEPNYLTDVTFLNPIWINGFYQWIKDIEIDYDWDNDEIFLTFNTYTYDDSSVSYEFVINNNDTLEDITIIGNPHQYLDTIFYVRNPIVLNEFQYKLFNVLFTNEDNNYTYSYNGYYNFYNNLTSISNPLFVVGYMSFNSTTYDTMTNQIWYNNAENDRTSLEFSYYSVEEQQYNFETYRIDNVFTRLYSVNLLFNGVKMPLSTYNALTLKGTFSYVRNTQYDDADFGDLLFSIADTPVYFISRLLSFELFGVNLFVALTGLLTLAIILVCIRKFF